MRSTTLLLLVLHLTISCSRSFGQGQIDPVWVEKLKTEGKESFDKYMILFGHIEEISQTRVEPEQKPNEPAVIPVRKRTDRVRVVRHGKNTLIERRTNFLEGSSLPQERYECENKLYQFTLNKSPKERGFVLVDYQPQAKSSLTEQSVGIFNNAVFGLREAFDAIAGRPNYTLRAVHMDPAKALLLVSSAFVTDGFQASSPIEQVVWVDPQRGWRVIEVTRETPLAQFRTQVTYDNLTVSGLAVPSSFSNVSIYKGVNAPPSIKITGTFESVGPTKLTDRDFRLSAFGLPEPIDTSPPLTATPIYLWFLLAAGMFASLAIGFRYLRSRGK